MVKSKVRKFQNNRKVIEVPKAVVDDYEIGEVVEFRKANIKGDK